VLTVSVGPGSGSAGSSYYPIKFTNSSSLACTLYGYPCVSFFVAATGAQVGAAATRDPAYPKVVVALAPGSTAHADLRITNAQNYPPSTCDPVGMHQLEGLPSWPDNRAVHHRDHHCLPQRLRSDARRAYRQAR